MDPDTQETTFERLMLNNFIFISEFYFGASMFFGEGRCATQARAEAAKSI